MVGSYEEDDCRVPSWMMGMSLVTITYVPPTISDRQSPSHVIVVFDYRICTFTCYLQRNPGSFSVWNPKGKSRSGCGHVLATCRDQQQHTTPPPSGPG
jgi:hypothetical protein